MTTLEHIDELLAAANDTRDIDEVVDLLLDWRLDISGEEITEECDACDGVGELPGNPNGNHFPSCPTCKGTGNKH